MGRFTPGRGGAVLGVCHVAGMLDMVALPIWVGTFIQFYGLSPAQAGATVTLFLVGVVLASLIASRLFMRLDPRVVVSCGFAVAAIAFGYLASRPIDTLPFLMLPVVHAIAGLAAGAALSMTHGTIGQAENPHRLFGLVNVALAIFSIAFFALVPGLIQSVSPRILFLVFASGLVVASITASLGFPKSERVGLTKEAVVQPIPANAWLVVVVVICLTFNQAMIFSFVERIGDHKGFSHAEVAMVLVVLGFVNLLPGMLAALTQKRFSPIAVGIVGPALQATLALLIVNAATFTTYAVFAIPYVSVVIFTHTFLFGLLSQIDASRRAVAATPAMMMIGSAAGPAVGGAIVENFSYGGLGYMAAAMSALAVILMLTFRVREAASLAVVRSA